MRRTTSQTFLAIALALLLPLCVSHKSAHAAGIAEPAAQALFEQGRKLMLEEKYDEACDKFAESYRLTSGVGTLLNLALCHEQVGKTATAYVEYHDALALCIRTNDSARVNIAHQRIAALEPKLSRITIMHDGSPSIPGLWLKLDGTSLGPSSVGAPIPIDPGKHRLQIGAPAKRTTQVEVTVTAGDKAATVVLPPLENENAEPERELPEPRIEQAPSHFPEPTRPNTITVSTTDSTSTYAKLATGASFGIAVIAATLGSYFGLDAFASWRRRNHHCEANVCDSIAVREADNARHSARLSNVLFVTAAVSVGAGVTLVLTAPTAPAPARQLPHRDVPQAMFSVRGHF